MGLILPSNFELPFFGIPTTRATFQLSGKINLISHVTLKQLLSGSPPKYRLNFRSLTFKEVFVENAPKFHAITICKVKLSIDLAIRSRLISHLRPLAISQS